MIQYDPMRIVPIESNCTNPLQCESNPIQLPIESNAISIRFSHLVLAMMKWHTLALPWVSCYSFLIHCILSFIRACHIAVKGSVALFICGLCVHARMKHEGMKKPCLLGRVAMWLIDSNVVASYISLH